MKNKINILLLSVVVASLLTLSASAMADEITGTLNTGISGNLGTVNGVVIVAPTANIVAGTYTSAQNVILTAAGSSSIHYTIGSTTPTCSTGTVYSGAISVGSSETINAVSCYLDTSSVAHPSNVVSFAYTINITTTGGGGGGGGGSVTTTNTNNNNPTWDPINVGISDLSIIAAQWGQTGSGLSADLNHDNTVDILDFSILAANWNGQ